MAVLVNNCFLFDGFHGRTCDVDPFDPSIVTANKFPIVDAEVSYTCSYTHDINVLITRNVMLLQLIIKSFLL